MSHAFVSYLRHRFSEVVISYAVWLYFRFSLSYRDVEALLAQRGIGVSFETIRGWCRKFGQSHANQLKRGFARAGDKWHLDEVRVARANLTMPVKGFKSVGHAQRFLCVIGTFGNHFRSRRHLMKASDYRATMLERFAFWHQLTLVSESA